MVLSNHVRTRANEQLILANSKRCVGATVQKDQRKLAKLSGSGHHVRIAKVNRWHASAAADATLISGKAPLQISTLDLLSGTIKADDCCSGLKSKSRLAETN